METKSTVRSFIQQGNFFIMDTEQVVSNPYQELHNEALDSVKKVSLTERLTSVRNNVCEHNLKNKKQHLEKERIHILRNLHVDTTNLRHQVKVMDINKRRNDLNLQKRLLPKKDFSYDARQIENSAKRIGITTENSFYLDKKLKYPLRGYIVKDHDAKPFIKQARKTLIQHTEKKKVENERAQTARTFERANTSLTVSTAVPSPPPSTVGTGKYKGRRGSKSAPPPIKTSAYEPQRSNSRLSTIDEPDSKLPNISSSSVRASTRNTKSHVKFQDEKILLQQSTPNTLYRSKTTESSRKYSARSFSETWDSDSDDDYTYCEKIDLRALLFGDKSESGDTKSAISGTTTPRTLFTRMSSEIPPLPKSQLAKPITEEQVLKEKREIRQKIDKFLGTINKTEEVVVNDEIEEDPEELEEQRKKAAKVSRASVLLSVFSKPLDNKKQWGQRAKTPEADQKQKEEAKAETVEEKKPESAQEKTVPKKDMWKFIKTNVQNGAYKKKYTANDLLLQQLTGILVHAEEKPKIPLHSASRALRHTPTFKMRRVVEELMRQRTRYEQQEVEKLQKQEELGEGGMYGGEGEGEEDPSKPFPTQAWAAPARQWLKILDASLLEI